MIISRANLEGQYRRPIPKVYHTEIQSWLRTILNKADNKGLHQRQVSMANHEDHSRRPIPTPNTKDQLQRQIAKASWEGQSQKSTLKANPECQSQGPIPKATPEGHCQRSIPKTNIEGHSFKGQSRRTILPTYLRKRLQHILLFKVLLQRKSVHELAACARGFLRPSTAAWKLVLVRKFNATTHPQKKKRALVKNWPTTYSTTYTTTLV